MPILKSIETKNSTPSTTRIQSVDRIVAASDSQPINASNSGVADASINSDFNPGYNAIVKRACDFTIGCIALLTLLPVFAVVSILIKLDSRGPAVFYQQRRGRNLEKIDVYKFRTMHHNVSARVPNAESFTQAKKDDPRVTRIGAFLRKTSLDELPQIFNVLQGSMSIVGPRPHPIPLDEKFEHVVPALNARYTVKPGLTGWAQIHGYRGETVHVEDMAARVEHDRYYIKHRSLWLDLKIIALTAIRGWTHNNAY